MTKSELIREMTETFDIPTARAQRIVDQMFETMSRSLLAGYRIEIRGFGSFSYTVAKGRLARNPRTGAPVVVGDRRRIAFKMSQKLLERLNPGQK